ncbi:hypothetical protein BDR26DRAFT_900409 [Obelidium mucronatum]|nr:hypothetical protein BDR26DRAFT_900409 [Obelidium mucronatum]
MTSESALMPSTLIIALLEVILLAAFAALVARDAITPLVVEISSANAARAEADANCEEAKRECRVMKHQLAESRNRELDLTEDLAQMTVKEKDTAAQLAILIREARGLDQQVAAASILLAAVPLVPSATLTIIALEIGAPIEQTVSQVSEGPQDMDVIIANLPPLPESPQLAFAFVTDVPESSATVEFTTTQDFIDAPSHATAPIDVIFPWTPTTTPATLATFPNTVPAPSVVTDTIVASTPPGYFAEIFFVNCIWSRQRGLAKD